MQRKLSFLKHEIKAMIEISEAVRDTTASGREANMHTGIIEFLAHGSDETSSFLLLEKANCDLVIFY